ncbi:TonB-dependent receptor [Kangiella marina]|uniref:TonB-dependent receptor n=1 Tax=Kangiella marina TaxID=1079178 RepID=A0ABP8IHT5_9GAMM
MTNKTMIAKAVKVALYSGFAASLAVGAPATFAAEEEEGAEAEKIVVTGSRLKRTDVEGALPVTVIDREQIDLSGDVSVADLLRNTTFNSFGSFRPQSGSSAQSFAELSLRGLGGGRSLILVDGRRAPSAPQVGSAQDLNSIPLAAVERIEILSDGASAIYGTDAIGGVVNVITRKDFDGAEVRVGASDPKRPGGSTDEGSIIFGASSDRASAYVGVSWNSREIVFQRDRPWSSGGVSTFGNNYQALATTTAFSGLSGVQNWTPDGSGCDAEGLFTIDGDAQNHCFYDFTALAADEAEIKNHAIFGRAQYQINDDWSTYFTASNSRVTSFGRYAPTPLFLFLPASSPNNYVGEDVLLRHRSLGTGTRDTNSDQDLYAAEWGFEGYLTDTVEMDFGIRRNEYKYDEFGRNYIVTPLMEAAAADGTYDILDPAGNPDSVLNSLKATINRESNTILDEVYVNTQFDLFEMGGGAARMLVGGEYRKETYQDKYDSLSEGGVIGGSAGNSAGGGRDVSALYFETLLPVVDNFEINLAGRYDDYSDFGDNFAPKVSFRYQPIDDVTLRASWGEGFRAPSLDILTAQPAFSADGTTDPDTCRFLTNNASCQTQTEAYALANPNLGPESSEQFSLGGAWQITDDLSMSADYYNIQLEDQITGIGTAEIVSCLRGFIPCPAGVSEIPNTARPGDASNGLGAAFSDPIPYDLDGDGTIGPNETIEPILFVQRGFINRGEIETSGLDLNVRNSLDMGGAGNLQTNFQVGYVQKYEIDGTDFVDQPGVPEVRANLSNTWSLGDFGLTWNVNYIADTLSTNGTFCDDFSDTANCVPDVDYDTTQPLRNSSWVTHDVQFNYATPWDGQISLGANNLTDKDPVLDIYEPAGRGYDFNLYDGYGRIVYLRYTQRF